jgi:hypothetical protein
MRLHLLPLLVGILLCAPLAGCGKTPASAPVATSSTAPTPGIEAPAAFPVNGQMAAVTLFHGDTATMIQFEAFAASTMKKDKVKGTFQAVDATSLRIVVFASEKQDQKDVKDYLKALAAKFKPA